MITIREAKTSDQSTISIFIEQLGYSQDSKSVAAILDNYSSTPFHKVFVAEVNSLVVGLISIAGIHSFVYEGIMYRITSLIVDNNHQKQGIGKHLIKHAETFAKNNFGKIIELTSGQRRSKTGSHIFYDHQGFKNEGPMAKLYLRKEII